MSLQRYPKYKDSGVEWLGEVPDGWEVIRLSRITWVRARLGWKGLKADEYVEDGFAFLATPNIKGRQIDFENVNQISKARFDESPEIKLSVGDVLLAKDGSTLGIVNVVKSLPRATTVNSSIAVITPNKKLLGEYLCFSFQSSYLENTIQLLKGGMGVPHLFQDDINRFLIPLPPLPEQTAIAAFLDRETGKIDALVSEQEKLIALLKEKRQALISHAVTKGLDPKAKMKDSGFEWLGEVPEGWEVRPIKTWFDTRSGGTPDTGKRDIYYTDENGIPWIRSTDLNNDRLTTHELTITELGMKNSACELIPSESVLIAMYGGDGTVGKNALLLKAACINQAVCALLPNSHFDFNFSFRYFQFYRPYWMIGAESSRKDPNISQALIRNSPIVRPPLPEQTAISAFLDRETGKIDALMQEAERGIELLKERRSALISTAVTGKIDVRGLG